MDTSSFGIPLIFLIFFQFYTSVLSEMIYLQPETVLKPVTYFTGDDFFVTCHSSSATNRLKWTDFDGNPISEEEDRIHVQEDDSDPTKKVLRLIFTDLEKEDTGQYTCSDDTHSMSFDLTVLRSISFLDTPSEQHLPEGETGVVLCNVRATAATPLIMWSFKGKKITSGSKYEIQENYSLKIFNVSRNDAGDYTCGVLMATSGNSQTRIMTITLHVQYIPEIIGDHKLTTYAVKGAKKNLICNITAVPTPMFQWLFDEMIIHNNTENFVIHDTVNSSVLTLVMDHEDKEGQYICRASNALGEKEVIINLSEGEMPNAPVLNVVGEDQGIVKLSITMKEDKPTSIDDVYLEVTGYKVEYRLSSETWDIASSKEFVIGEQYELKNMSFNSEYMFRASARNAVGYGNYSEEITYTTHSLQTASVVSSGSGVLSCLELGLFLISIFITFSL